MKKIDHLVKGAFSAFRYKCDLLHPRLHYLKMNIIELDNISELQKIFSWKNSPILNDPNIYECDSIVDINERRIRDAECIGVIMHNSSPKIAVEIGTSTGHTTALMAENAPDSQIYTVNIPPEEIYSGEGGIMTTVALEKEKIGSYYREKILKI